VDPWGWTEVGELVTSVGVGVISALVPLINAEAYVVASQMSALAGPIPVAIGIAIGQSIGKVLLFLGVRRGKQFPFVRRERNRLRNAQVGPVRQRFRRAVAALLALIGRERWGLPIVLLAAVTGIPPLYAVALLAGATRMRLGWFSLTVLVGRLARFVLVVQGVGVLHLH
jgi:membrane protein YqaA with SNARE-associated domain